MSLLVLTNNTSLLSVQPPTTVKLKVGQTPAGVQGVQGEQGLQGEQGEQGIQGNAFVYTDFTAQQLLDLKGEKGIKGEQGDPVPITTVLGQSATQAVSQKLLTDVLGDLESALTAINGV